MIEKTFSEVFTYRAICNAHARARASKRDKKPIVKFEMKTLENAYALYKRLSAGNFRFQGYNHFTVYEPKRREIQTLHYSDRVVQHVLCDEVLSPYFTSRAVLDNAVCQKGKGAHFALARFEKMLAAHIRKYGAKGYFLKCDVSKYFPAIPHSKLKQIILRHIRDQRIKDLVEQVIDSYHTDEGYLSSCGYRSYNEPLGTGRGIPIGNQTSQVFGMYYLNSVDRLVKERLRIKAYSRYMDDFIMVHQSKEYLQCVLNDIRAEVSALGLNLNSKTQIFPFKNGVTYLGFRYTVTPQGKIIKTVKKRTKKRMRFRARLLKKAYCQGAIPSERVRASLAAFHGHLKHARCYKLEKELFEKLKEIAFAKELRRQAK